MLQDCNKNFSWRPAATSCVWPDTAAVNCRRLARTVPEVGLYLLETMACLAYGPKDLPQKTYGLTYHLHLPLDLPWRLGGETAFSMVESLLEKTAHLSPWGFVLHPPEDGAALAAFLAAWAQSGRDPKDILLENTETAAPGHVLDTAAALGCSVCLDLGHMLAMGHGLDRNDPRPAQLARMLHVYSPFGAEGPPAGRTHVHRPLTTLSPEGRELLLWMLAHLAPRTIVLEVFSPIHLLESLAVLTSLAEAAGAGT